MYIQLFLLIFCFTAQMVYADVQSNSDSLPLTEEQQFLWRKDQLQKKIDNFNDRLERLRNHSEFPNLAQDISIATLFKIAEKHAAFLQRMTPSEYHVYYSELEEYIKDQQAEDDDIQEFKHAIEYLQRTVLIDHSVNEIFIFGILYEFFYDYIQINQDMFIINAQSNNLKTTN